MNLYMLYEKRLGPVPEDIEELQCFDAHMTIVVGNNERVNGRSVYLNGPKESFINWLKPFDHIWIGEGQPMEERFSVAHIK